MAYPTGELSVDLRAIADNWRLINSKLREGAQCGAVVKANAYGLGVDRIAPKIYGAGCRHFFVANGKEAMQLRSLIGLDAHVYVLSGCIEGAEAAFVNRNLTPVIVSVPMLKRWASYVKDLPEKDLGTAVLKINTGMGRLGLELSDCQSLLNDNSSLLRDAKIRMLMSHLACADDHLHPLNQKQLQRFKDFCDKFGEKEMPVLSTLSNSAGVFLNEETHGDIVRPGVSLYGGNPGLAVNPMQNVVGLTLPIIQIRDLPAGESVGYGATCSFDGPRKIAVVSGGYADGIMRSLSNKGWGVINSVKAPIVGRISMDSTMFDVTEAAKQGEINESHAIELLGANVTIDELADAAGTISYEILTSLGARYQRCYIE